MNWLGWIFVGRFLGSPAARGVEVFERQPIAVKLRVTAGAGGTRAMDTEVLADALGIARIRNQGSDVGRRRWGRSVKESVQYISPADDGPPM